jgi:hypothetical protein
LKRFFIYKRNPNHKVFISLTTDFTVDDFPIVGVVESMCESNTNPRCPGALETARAFFGPTAEVVDSRFRKCNLTFDRIGDTNVFVRRGSGPEVFC